MAAQQIRFTSSKSNVFYVFYISG